MNPLGSLNLSTHDEGVAAIANFPIALDWLAIAFPPITNNNITSQAQPPFPPPPPSTSPQTPFSTIPFPRQPPDPISKRQASSAIVRHFRPYAFKEVLAPCFRVAGRFILGRTLGNLYVPPELGIPQLATEPCADARFVLDLQNGSIVEVRQYPATNALLCIAYAARRAEYLSLPPYHLSRLEITYRRDHSVPSPAPDFPLFDDVPRSNIPQQSWHHFCINYSSIFPTGPLTATISSDPGPATAAFRKESITVTMNDPFAMSFSSSAASLYRMGQARRIAPKRLLPRPAT